MRGIGSPRGCLACRMLGKSFGCCDVDGVEVIDGEFRGLVLLLNP